MSGQAETTQGIGLRDVLQSFRHWGNLFALIWGASPGYLIRIVMLYLLLGIVPILSLVATQQLINGVVTGVSAGGKQALGAFAWYVGVLVFKQGLSLAQAYYEGLFQQLIANTVQGKVMEKAVTLGLADIENTQVQEQLKRAQQDVMFRPYQMFTQMLGVINHLVTLVSTVLLLIVWKWWVVLVVAATTGISFFTMLSINREQFLISYERASKHREAWYYGFVLTHDKAVKEVRLFQLGSFFLDKFKAIYQDFYLVDRRMAKKRLIWSSAYQGLNLLSLAGMIYLAVREAFQKLIQVGDLYGYVQAITLTQSSAQTVFSNVLAICQHNLYIEQLFVFLALPSSEPALRLADASGQEQQSLETIETFEFRNVSFRYPGTERDVLRNVSFTLRRGECIAVVGRNGSGKSTLAKLMTQLYEGYEGEILVNGSQTSAWGVAQLQKRIGVLFQDFMQYEMSVRHNIGFGNTLVLAQDDKLLEASDRTGIGSFVRNLPKQLNTELGRWLVNGEQLSGGQWQRIAIARAFVREADLYVLDEPNAALDPIAESEVFEKIRDLLRDRLGLFIAHRLTSARFANQILVMEDGAVIEQGTHDELMARNGQYAEMYRVQMKLYEVKT
ncbi:ABC transporter ATP-binding protein [Tumebacillus permanentifrigoris]|uniref:ATP-binding cassette subfamily B protein n=1 Tax=Tumebacillus permanentifrigoris TaxID=378543 RepID=A0A316DY18_9BACL|nr:ABC transporter ATP-binding protein [Tumebacillus permanentifrigoris]PWK15011.1 ATP-binding cassette subfamily B protein [Tumebacillus permanentifrigoris]